MYELRLRHKSLAAFVRVEIQPHGHATLTLAWIADANMASQLWALWLEHMLTGEWVIAVDCPLEGDILKMDEVIQQPTGRYRFVSGSVITETMLGDYLARTLTTDEYSRNLRQRYRPCNHYTYNIAPASGGNPGSAHEPSANGTRQGPHPDDDESQTG